MRVRAFCFLTLLSGYTTALHAHEGWGIVRTTRGVLYVADIPANTIWAIAPSGYAASVRRDVHSHALMLGADGALYGTHVHLTQPLRSVWRLDAQGMVSDVVPATRGLPLDLQTFAIGPDGAIYSMTRHEFELSPEQRRLFLLRRSSDGRVDTLAGGLKGHADGKGAAARFTSVDGTAWLPDGNLLIVDGARLRRVSADGDVVSLTDELATLSWDQDLMGVTVAGDGAVYVADFSGHRVLRAEGRGARTVSSSGWYWSPTGVHAATDALYILEHPRAPLGILGDLRVGPYLRVRVMQPDGNSYVLARLWGTRTIPLVMLFLLLIVVAATIRRMRRRGGPMKPRLHSDRL